MKPFFFLACFSLALGACTARDKVVDFSIDQIERYCSASEASRQALREEFTTSKGPLLQVNCENLE